MIFRKKSSPTHDALTLAAERASDAGRRLVEVSSAMQERAHEAMRATRRGSHDYGLRLRDVITEHPLTSLGVAVAVTAVLSTLLARR